MLQEAETFFALESCTFRMGESKLIWIENTSTSLNLRARHVTSMNIEITKANKFAIHFILSLKKIENYIACVKRYMVEAFCEDYYNSSKKANNS